MGVEKLPVQNRKQPGPQIALRVFAAPTRQRTLQARLHQIVGAAGIAGQRDRKATQPGDQFT
ncbi:hypothetical protein D3C81_1806540 [compost metagenome]